MSSLKYFLKPKKLITDDDYEDLVESGVRNGNINVSGVSGLFYYENEIDEKREKSLIDFLDEGDGQKWKKISDSKNSRKVQHYGYLYNYKTGKTKEKGEPIPDEFEFLISILSEKFGKKFNQVIVNNYEEGQGISAHTDVKEYGDMIGCYTIGSGATMTFSKGEKKCDLYVRSKSLYVMTGESRYEWKHEMASRKSDVVNDIKVKRGRRISITFRYVPL